MNVYIAAPYPLRPQAIAVAKMIALNGHRVTSRWLHPTHDQDDQGPELTAWARHAHEDLLDIDACDLFLALNPPDWANVGTGGRHVEFGYAFAQDKTILLVGDRTNAFHHLEGVQHIDHSASIEQAIHDIQHKYGY